MQLDPGGVAALAPRDPREEEIRRLEREVATLTEQLARTGVNWDAGLADARRSALAEAVEVHRRDDALLAERLGEALDDARRAFSRTLDAAVLPLAADLAATALRRLVEERQDETDWLLRHLQHCLTELAGQRSVAVRLPPGPVGEAALAALASIPHRSAVLTIDPKLKPGTARIELEMGEIEIAPEAGLATLLALLEQSSAA